MDIAVKVGRVLKECDLDGNGNVNRRRSSSSGIIGHLVAQHRRSLAITQLTSSFTTSDHADTAVAVAAARSAIRIEVAATASGGRSGRYSRHSAHQEDRVTFIGLINREGGESSGRGDDGGTTSARAMAGLLSSVSKKTARQWAKWAMFRLKCYVVAKYSCNGCQCDDCLQSRVQVRS